MKKHTFFEISYKDFHIRYGNATEYDDICLIEYQKDENFLIEFSKDIFGIIPKIIKWFLKNYNISNQNPQPE